MKKLKLNTTSFKNGTVLSRNELRKISGGGILSSCFAWCDCPSGMTPIPGAGTLRIQVDCLGMCSAQNNVGAGCDSTFHSCASMDFSSYCA
jgi:hypothetical protein